MTTIQLLEQLGADPAFQINASMRQQLLDELQDAPKINFVGLVPPQDEKENNDNKGASKSSQH